MGTNKPPLIVDQYIERINVALSVSLGIYEAASISKQVHYLRSLFVFFLVIMFTFFLQYYGRHMRDRYNGLFLLFWRIADKLITFIQQFLTTISLNIVIQKVQENRSDTNSIGTVATFMIYIVAFVFLTTVVALFGWYFYEQREHDTLPDQLVTDLTKKTD